MNGMIRNTFLAISLVLITATSSFTAENEISGELQAALDQAGNNRAELLAALEKVPSGQREGMEFLIVHMPRRDLESLTADFLLQNTALAYRAIDEAPWGDQIPNDLFLNDILPYASVSESRDPWRKDFHERFAPLVKDCKTPGEAAQLLNKTIFKELNVRYSRKRLKADQSPKESIESGTASCTGLAVVLIDACRAVGVPARFVGTPLWADRSGNHSWVEVWDKTWHFTGAAEPSSNGLDHAWFVHRASQAKHDPPQHAIYAVSYRKTPLRFPMVWKFRADYVYAVNVTDRYTQSQQPLDSNMTRLAIRAFDVQDGERVSAKVDVVNVSDGKSLFQGMTKDERFDGNDHLTVNVPIDSKVRIALRHEQTSLEKTVTATPKEMLQTFVMADGNKITAEQFALTPDDREFIDSPGGREVAAGLKAYFDAPPIGRDKVALKDSWDALLLEHSAAVRHLAWDAYCHGDALREMTADHEANRVTFQEYVCPYVVRKVGSMPKSGWPLFIAMHGGGGAPKRVNDSQWRVMQRYYRDQADVEGYLYLALRAPNDKWNGFYDSYNLPLTARLIRQLVLLENVDSDKVFIMGYSHGGYGAFYIGPKMADRFAAVHVSAAAPTGNHASPKNLRNTVFTFMVGERDTAYGRLERCQKFNEQVEAVRGEQKDVYPVTFEYKAGYGHGGLPDRDKIKSMYPARRNPVPDHVVWELTDATVKDFYWLHIPNPEPGKEVEAVCRDNRLTITGEKLETLDVLLDERMIDYGRAVVVEVAGKTTTQQLSPSVKTLCETLQQRGDPQLVFTSRLSPEVLVPAPGEKP